MTRQDILDSLSGRELVEAVASRMVTSLSQEAESIGAELGDYEIDSFSDKLDDFSMEVQNAIERKLPGSFIGRRP